MTGYNDITSGNPNPKTLVPGYQLANESTNDALYPMAFAEESLSLALAEDVLCRMQQGLRKGGISGYATAMNTNTLRFIAVSPDIALRDYGIELEKKTSDDQKAWLLQMMQQDIANGFLNTSDAVTLVNTKNAKQAQMIWSYKVSREKQNIQNQKMQQIQEQNKGAEKKKKIAQDGALQQIQIANNFELQKQKMLLDAEIEKERMKIESAERIAMASNQTKIMVATETADSKESTAFITGQHSVAKQEIANKKQNQPTI